MAAAWIDQSDRHHWALAELLGADNGEQRQNERRTQLRAVDGGRVAGPSSSPRPHMLTECSSSPRRDGDRDDQVGSEIGAVSSRAMPSGSKKAKKHRPRATSSRIDPCSTPRSSSSWMAA